VRNPFRSEAEAYRFVMLTVGYFAAIVIAKAVLGDVGAFIVFLVLTFAVIVWIVRSGRRERPPPTAPAHRHPENERRILVVANQTVGGESLRNAIRERSEGFEEHVLVVVPVLNSPVRHWTSDEDPARAEAAKRLARSLERLKAAGVDARGEIGDSEPVQAIEDWMRLFDADEIIISTHPEGRSHWLEKGVVREARQRFDVPITHVVVDLEAEREEVGETF
jgi:hypothetical protein